MMSDPADVARACLKYAIKYLDEVQACPFCDLGHTVEEDAVVTHAIGCPFRGYERTEEVERLNAWLASTQAKDVK